MAAPTDNHLGSLPYQTWTLRVPIHCEGCKKKVKKILQKIDGVYMTTVDAQQHKVVVNGNIDAETLLKKLSKSGKPAELWPGMYGKTEKLPQLPMIKDGGDPKTNKGGKKENLKSSDEGGLKTQKSLPDKIDIPQNDPNAPIVDGGQPPESQKGDQIEGGGKKKKKSKGQGGNSVIVKNVVPPQQSNGQDNSVINENSAPPLPLPETPAAVALPAEPPVALPAAPISAQAEPPALISAQAEPPAAGTPAPTATAPVQVPVMPPMDQNRPMEPINNGPPINLGPPNNHGLPYESCHGPGNNFGPINHPNDPFSRPPPQMGVSYSMAQPSSSSSYYAPPYYAYAYSPHPMMYVPPPPPPPQPLNEVYGNYHYYDDNDYNNNSNDNAASQCRLM